MSNPTELDQMGYKDFPNHNVIEIKAPDDFFSDVKTVAINIVDKAVFLFSFEPSNADSVPKAMLSVDKVKLEDIKFLPDFYSYPDSGYRIVAMTNRTALDLISKAEGYHILNREPTTLQSVASFRNSLDMLPPDDEFKAEP